MTTAATNAKVLASMVGLFFAAPPASVAAPPPLPTLRPGHYGSLSLGYDAATKGVSGYFSETTGAGKFSCIFALGGVMGAANAKISTWYPLDKPSAEPPIVGDLALRKDNTVAIGLKTEHGGCWNVTHFADKGAPATFELEQERPWTAVRVVKSARAFFYTGPNGKKLKSYVVAGDGVGVLEQKSAAGKSWLKAEYVGSDHGTIGWLTQEDLAASLAEP